MAASVSSLEELASLIRRNHPAVSIEFAGWQDETGRARLLADADALVVPSIWPEPFGLVGLEAAAAGVPAIAFRVGGIPEWLHDGENGCLASSSQTIAPRHLPTRSSAAFEPAARLRQLRDGARRSASQMAAR